MPLRVLSYNILFGGEDRLPQIGNVIRMHRPDVVALLEANSRSNAGRLAQELGMQLVFGEANSEFHVAWLSCLPVLWTENHRLPVLAKTLLEIEVLWEDTPIHLFATHLIAGRDKKSGQHRVEEMRTILNILQSPHGWPHLLVGDMNAIHPADQVGVPAFMDETAPEIGYISREVISLLLQAGYVDCYRQLHPTEPGYSYKVPNLWLRLDYIFASPQLAPRLHACDLASGPEAMIASDHLPIWAEFR